MSILELLWTLVISLCGPGSSAWAWLPFCSKDISGRLRNGRQRDVIDKHQCLHAQQSLVIPIDISFLSVLTPLNKKHITFPQFIILHSYYVITTVYPILTSPRYKTKYVGTSAFSFECDLNGKILLGLKRLIDQRSLVYFSNNLRNIIGPCIENGEGLCRKIYGSGKVHFQFWFLFVTIYT